ncbi:unnamed protein product [Enterobius vermicularis]|uniref:N-acetyltransferase domain-containing protein n=1 Tax=Enterobius vermicularis TaxID=51028 RepID=A0A158Q978_ENTVE|nr:unnamed protein product [Enterobius vermicularis]
MAQKNADILIGLLRLRKCSDKLLVFMKDKEFEIGDFMEKSIVIALADTVAKLGFFDIFHYNSTSGKKRRLGARALDHCDHRMKKRTFCQIYLPGFKNKEDMNYNEYLIEFNLEGSRFMKRNLAGEWLSRFNFNTLKRASQSRPSVGHYFTTASPNLFLVFALGDIKSTTLTPMPQTVKLNRFNYKWVGELEEKKLSENGEESRCVESEDGLFRQFVTAGLNRFNYKWIGEVEEKKISGSRGENRCTEIQDKDTYTGGVSIVRELHVYGSVVPVSTRNPNKFQHQGFGLLLMEEAERIAKFEHCSKKIAVISGVGTRNYYRLVRDTYCLYIASIDLKHSDFCHASYERKGRYESDIIIYVIFKFLLEPNIILVLNVEEKGRRRRQEQRELIQQINKLMNRFCIQSTNSHQEAECKSGVYN